MPLQVREEKVGEKLDIGELTDVLIGVQDLYQINERKVDTVTTPQWSENPREEIRSSQVQQYRAEVMRDLNQDEHGKVEGVHVQGRSESPTPATG